MAILERVESAGLSQAQAAAEMGVSDTCHSGETGCVNPPKIQSRAKNYPLARQISAIPAFFFCHSGESRNPAQIERGTRTLQRRQPAAPLQGARSARFIRWIPACAGMARWGMGMAGKGQEWWGWESFPPRLPNAWPGYSRAGISPVLMLRLALSMPRTGLRLRVADFVSAPRKPSEEGVVGDARK